MPLWKYQTFMPPFSKTFVISFQGSKIVLLSLQLNQVSHLLWLPWKLLKDLL